MSVFNYDYADKDWWNKQSILQAIRLRRARKLVNNRMATRIGPKKIPDFMTQHEVEEDIPHLLKKQAH